MNIHRIGILLMVVALALTACGPLAVAPAAPTAAPQPTEPAAKVFRVAVVLPSAVNDFAFSQSMYDALNKIQAEMGGPERMEFVYSQGMFVVNDATEALRTYASKGYDLVIAHGSQYGDSVKQVAPDFPNVSFIYSNAVKSTNMPNVYDVNAAAEEGGYVNGVLAAALTKSKVVSVIGPIESGEPKAYVDGFKAGVLATVPDAKLNVTYIGSFSDVVKGSDVANQDITAGADVMTGTSQMVVGPIGKANESNVAWFGTQSNQTSLATRVVVANQVYHWEVALRQVIAQIQSGKRGGEVVVINLANGGEAIEYNPDYALPAEARAMGDAAVKGIADGTIKVQLP